LGDLLKIHDYDLGAFVDVAADFGADRYGYVVTPNADHLVRYHENPHFRATYEAADYVLLDSRALAAAIRLLKGLRIRVCTGADLTARLLSRIVAPSDRIVLIGGSAAQARRVAELCGLEDLRHHNPPMGFTNDHAATEECLQFIEEQAPFRFCFLAVGSPQQELLARQLQSRGRARGLVLCVGAAVNFISGAERRAPRWVQRLALEWLFRLVLNPRRLAHRYLVRAPRALALLARTRIVLHSAQPVGRAMQSTG
jgi:exopolysaccharide biosynthesis WecB/TagA/CpsF family protein